MRSPFVVLAAVLAITAPQAAAAASPDAAPPSLFACWVTPLAVSAAGEVPPVPAQRCEDDQVGGASGVHTVGNVRVQAVDATGTTSRTTGAATATASGTATLAGGTPAGDAPGQALAATTQSGRARASAASTSIVAGSTRIQLGSVLSDSTITCTYDASGAHFSFFGRSSVSSVRINGRAVRLRNGAMDIPLPSGTLHLNQIEVRSTGVVTHPAILDTATAHVVIADSAVAIAETQGNPCRPGQSAGG
jgi:hypothetical protein